MSDNGNDNNANLTDEDVTTILNLFEESEFDYLQFEAGDLKLTVSKQGFVPDAVPTAREAPETVVAQREPEAATEPDPAPLQPNAVADTPSRDGLAPVTAPIVGTFYAAPDPQSPPFVSVGDRVEEGTTVGLIEVMKVFTGIRAGVAGEIAESVVVNATLVEQGAVLFYVRPDASGG